MKPYVYNCTLVKIVDGDTIDVDIDLGFGVECGTSHAWLRNNEQLGGNWVVSQVVEDDTVVVIVDMASQPGSALFRTLDGIPLKVVGGVGGGDIYPAAAFRCVGTIVSFVDPGPKMKIDDPKTWEKLALQIAERERADAPSQKVTVIPHGYMIGCCSSRHFGQL